MIKLERFIDRYVGNVLCFILGIFTTTPGVLAPKKIIVVKLWAVGESVLTLPMIHLLKKKYPEAQIDVFTRKRNKDVYMDDTDVTNVFLFEDKPFRLFKKYDVAIDCEPYLNVSALFSFFLARYALGFDHGMRARLYTHKIHYNDEQHVVQTYCDLLRFFDIFERPTELVRLGYEDIANKNALRLLQERKIKGFLVGFCCGAAESGQGRKWAKERFAQLAEKLILEYNATVLLVGSPSEKELNEQVFLLVNKKYQKKIYNLAGLTNLKESFVLIEQCDLFISNDTGPMHIAAAQGVRTIGLFGPNTPVRFGPFGKKNGFIYKPTLSKPCINVHIGSVPDCEGHAHMEQITVDDVMKEIKKKL